MLNIGPGELGLFVVICGLISAGVARRKGHRGSRYFVVGVLFPVIGLVVSLAIPRRR